MFKVLAPLAAAILLGCAGSAAATTTVMPLVTGDGVNYTVGMSDIALPSSGERYRISIDFEGLAVDSAYISFFGQLDRHWWDPIIGGETGNNYYYNFSCAKGEPCFDASTPGRLEWLFQTPTDLIEPCTPLTVGDCQRVYNWAGLHTLYATFHVDGSGEPPAARFSFERIAPVPEPSTWAMMIVGFAVAGVALRRQHPWRLAAQG